MKQITLTSKKGRNIQELEGKTIKGVSFCGEHTCYDNHPYLIITFTDDTYIYLALKPKDDDDDTYHLTDEMAFPLNIYAYPPIESFDSDGNPIYYPYVEEEIRLGLTEPDREVDKRRYDEIKKAEEEREYRQYLKLKERFEK